MKQFNLLALFGVLLTCIIGFATPASADGKFTVIYNTPSTPRYTRIQELCRQAGFFESLIAQLNSKISLPTDIPVTLSECGQANAFYSPKNNDITMCFELIDQFTFFFAPYLIPDGEKSLGQSFTDELNRARNGEFGSIRKMPTASVIERDQKRIRDSVAFIFYHEAGHALIHNLDLPITGKEEDAVDQLATYISIDKNVGGDKVAVNAATAFMTFDPGLLGLFSKMPFADEHSIGRQRFYNILCWVYGSDTEKWATIINDGTLPSSRGVRCPHEYAQLSRSWETLLSAHSRGIGAKIEDMFNKTPIRIDSGAGLIPVPGDHLIGGAPAPSSAPLSDGKVAAKSVRQKSGSELFFERAGTSALVKQAQNEERAQKEKPGK